MVAGLAVHIGIAQYCVLWGIYIFPDMTIRGVLVFCLGSGFKYKPFERTSA